MTAVTLVCFGLTTDSTEEERATLIAIILHVAAAMHHIHQILASTTSASMDEGLEQELQTSR